MTTHSLDACLRLVADRHRRWIIHHLRHEATGTTTVDELVEQFHSSDFDSKNVPLQDRDAFAIQLHHIHLPKLAEHGVVEFEHRSGAVRYHPDEQVESVLDSLSGGVSIPNP
ncbi:hypothetical protein SAMN04487949_3647 [Halogranum gelatinilyticum]|uniref:DUF7344 domain-containing protein n=1 Tax=Halogranum gelatinilyticum TaxID=660521 RepID=A0A1G9ZFV4_9EURY|nr:transcriptional regulator [Halogranum gelatinilyticum]SDN20144.1 hypothetical protein SAMN04487949_3647 [Halogranum gelatinilyticum]